ncbi:MAG: hypothetical protein ACO3Z6_12250 [Pseudomonadales bacterium]
MSASLNARVAVLSQNMIGQYKSSTKGKNVSNEEILTVRPTIMFTPSDTLDITLIGECQQDESEPKPQQNESAFGPILCSRYGYCGVALGDGDEFKVEMDEMSIDALNQPEIGRLGDASISFESDDGGYPVAVFGKNLIDQTYLQSATNVSGLFSTRLVNQPRRWGVEFVWYLHASADPRPPPSIG